MTCFLALSLSLSWRCWWRSQFQEDEEHPFLLDSSPVLCTNEDVRTLQQARVHPLVSPPSTTRRLTRAPRDRDCLSVSLDRIYLLDATSFNPFSSVLLCLGFVSPLKLKYSKPCRALINPVTPNALPQSKGDTVLGSVFGTAQSTSFPCPIASCFLWSPYLSLSPTSSLLCGPACLR